MTKINLSQAMFGLKMKQQAKKRIERVVKNEAREKDRLTEDFKSDEFISVDERDRIEEADRKQKMSKEEKFALYQSHVERVKDYAEAENRAIYTFDGWTKHIYRTTTESCDYIIAYNRSICPYSKEITNFQILREFVIKELIGYRRENEEPYFFEDNWHAKRYQGNIYFWYSNSIGRYSNEIVNQEEHDLLDKSCNPDILICISKLHKDHKEPELKPKIKEEPSIEKPKRKIIVGGD